MIVKRSGDWNLLLLIAATWLLILHSVIPSAAVNSNGVSGKDSITVRSFSGQFIVNSSKTLPPLPAAAGQLATNLPKTIEIDPNLLVVICERIKENILFFLKANDEWKGTVIINIFPAKSLFDPVWINAQYTDRGWMYYVDVPSRIDMARLVNAVVGVLLQEMADRGAGSKPAELPPWIAPAFSLNVQLTAPDITIIEPFSKKTRVDRRTNPINLIKRRLISVEPLSWDELSWGDDQYFNDFSSTNQYAICSYLFTHQLLRLPDGAEKLKKFLHILPSRWNWQIAFLDAFKPHFYSMRDVEKWWSVSIAALTGRTEMKTLTFEETLKKLDDIVDSPVKIPIKNNGQDQTNSVSAAVVKKIPLQQIITQYNYSQHKQLIREKAAELSVLKQQAHPALKKLIDDYRIVLENYLSRRYRAGFEEDSPKLVTRDTINKLDELDFIRSDFREYGVFEQEQAPLYDDFFNIQPHQSSQIPPLTQKK
ncbi:MAG: hypothetical protein ACP5T0_06325 [Verrucomicrobiia bacterium]